jgi:hypothetical protein
MGTRGLMAFAHDGKLKAMYNHWDSYPSGLGTDMVKWMNGQNGDFSDAIEQFDRLEAVSEDTKPTEDQKLALLRYMNLDVSSRSSDEWYVLLRNTQGDPAETLKAGFFVDSSDFGGDSLFCEWAYVVDLDRKVLEVYEGFATAPHDTGRWATMEPRPLSYSDTVYYPVKLIREYTAQELAEDPDVLIKLEEFLAEQEGAADSL